MTSPLLNSIGLEMTSSYDFIITLRRECQAMHHGKQQWKWLLLIQDICKYLFATFNFYSHFSDVKFGHKKDNRLAFWLQAGIESCLKISLDTASELTLRMLPSPCPRYVRSHVRVSVHVQHPPHEWEIARANITINRTIVHAKSELYCGNCNTSDCHFLLS